MPFDGLLQMSHCYLRKSMKSNLGEVNFRQRLFWRMNVENIQQLIQIKDAEHRAMRLTEANGSLSFHGLFSSFSSPFRWGKDSWFVAKNSFCVAYYARVASLYQRSQNLALPEA